MLGFPFSSSILFVLTLSPDSGPMINDMLNLAVARLKFSLALSRHLVMFVPALPFQWPKYVSL